MRTPAREGALTARYFGNDKRDNFYQIQKESINSGTLLESLKNLQLNDSVSFR